MSSGMGDRRLYCRDAVCWCRMGVHMTPAACVMFAAWVIAAFLIYVIHF